MGVVKIMHLDEAIDLHELSGDRCLIELGGQSFVLSYDSTFELALKLSTFLRDIEDREDLGFASNEPLN